MELQKPLTLEGLNKIKLEGGRFWPYTTAPYLYMEKLMYKRSNWIDWETVYDMITQGFWDYRADTYAKTWRLWASKPTDDERDAAPWGFFRLEVD
nr:MAG TPA: hypothetical protein [Bacteriophage sp.]